MAYMKKNYPNISRSTFFFLRGGATWKDDRWSDGQKTRGATPGCFVTRGLVEDSWGIAAKQYRNWMIRRKISQKV